MKNILLIGGAGYVGTVICSHLLKKGYRVSMLDNFIYENQSSVYHFIGDPDFDLVYGDIRNKKDLEKASKNITDVILLAGLVGDPITKKYPDYSQSINEYGVKNCIDFFLNSNIDKFIFISTCSNYGFIKENELANENFVLNPLSAYAKAKVNNEEYLISKKNSAKFSAVVLRFATAFGISPRMRFDLTISEFVRDLFFGKELLVYDENTWRPYCHVRDFALLLEKVINSENEKLNFEVFNAGGELNNYTKKMIVNEIVKLLPKSKVIYGKMGGDPRNYRVDFTKVESVFDFKPQYSVSYGIEELINALSLGFYKDSIHNNEKYGNYLIKEQNF